MDGDDISPFVELVVNGSQKLLIAAIEGFALAGGLELALTCDVLVAARGAKLGIPEAGGGLLAAAGGLLRLPSSAGYGRAMEMAITAARSSTRRPKGSCRGLPSRAAR